ncbi:MAG: RluA family pseudouridine synthase [Planctomycetes bacterium]|nr:RluA family pseudouridine synthase [Planctomycetota bacterium]
MDYHLTVAEEQSGILLDQFLAGAFPNLTKTQLRRVARDGRVLVNGQAKAPSARLRENDVVSMLLDDEIEDSLAVEAAGGGPDRLEIPILYEDEHVICLDKPPHLACEPDRWDKSRAHLLDSLGAQLSQRPAAPQLRIVHRLDRETSGAMLVAKTLEAERVLRRAFDEHRIQKTYLALVEGDFGGEDGEVVTIDLPLGPDARRSGLVVVRDDGKHAVTEVSVEQRFRGYTLLTCRPLTGRTHQIRVHLSTRGFPLAVDPVYGRRKALALSDFKAGYRKKPGRVESALIDRLSLHSTRTVFPRVGSTAEAGESGESAGAWITVEAPMPKDFARVLKQLAKFRPTRR